MVRPCGPLDPSIERIGAQANAKLHASGQEDARVASAVLYHPDYTVGPGITPGLLTPLPKGNERSRADALSRDYRRWGISPRPENVHRHQRRHREQ
ncbi:hypothetical protein KL86PLE_130211 [uncultured Pleomorphomonas sp.]|uniref:Uncharacterized protein n=1 Tax=uncultured Pleomorphomonas sp. TaxID=442121 RepID=A0A212LA97_9HYPH|nr:hypothetical protein KL86PLE_130211 [uncultured Pleomorphomonas sp.]